MAEKAPRQSGLKAVVLSAAKYFLRSYASHIIIYGQVNARIFLRTARCTREHIFATTVLPPLFASATEFAVQMILSKSPFLASLLEFRTWTTTGRLPNAASDSYPGSNQLEEVLAVSKITPTRISKRSRLRAVVGSRISEQGALLNLLNRELSPANFPISKVDCS
ncbi:hypothetical protein PABG_11852 [Paracoccidioides brasiliensis Pb03]|nr:hypothetical protein PABG_11852 [Paracoccidioides brasiliensis Pb03]